MTMKRVTLPQFAVGLPSSACLALIALLSGCGGSADGSQAPPPVTVPGTGNPAPAPALNARCTIPNRTDGVSFGANVNALFWESHYQDQRLLTSVRSLGQPVIRLPGGTESDYFDWTLGRPVDACRYNSCRTWDSATLTQPALYQGFGSFQNSTSDSFAAFSRNVGGRTLLVANTMTASVEENVRWIGNVRAAGDRVSLIELGNEPYFGQVEGTDNTQRLYPTAASHVAYARRMATALRNSVPGVLMAYPAFVPRVDGTTGTPTAGHDERMLTWNDRMLAAGIAGDVDAFALHFYPRLPGRRGANDEDYLRTLSGFPESYWQATVRQPQWSVLPANKRLWITELNASFADAPELVGSWVHGLIQAQLMLLMIQDARVDVVLQHMLAGNPQWQAVVHPGRMSDIPVAPGFTPYALTATGETLAVLSDTLRDATCVERVETGAAGAVGVFARSASDTRAVFVNISNAPVTIDIQSLGWTSATAIERTAVPLGRPAAGTAISISSLTPRTDGRGIAIAPYALTTLRGTP